MKKINYIVTIVLSISVIGSKAQSSLEKLYSKQEIKEMGDFLMKKNCH